MSGFYDPIAHHDEMMSKYEARLMAEHRRHEHREHHNYCPLCRIEWAKQVRDIAQEAQQRWGNAFKRES